MRTSSSFALAAALLGAAPASAQDHRIIVREAVRSVLPPLYQGRNRGPEQTEHFSRRVRIGRDGRVNLSNISGDIAITGGSGDEVSIEAVKRTRADRSELGNVQIVVDEGAGRVDIRTDYPTRGNNHVSVDFTLTVPSSTSVEVHSISGDVRLTNIQGTVRAETISGNVTTSGSPHVAFAKSVSGDVDLSGANIDGDLTAGTISGSIRARGVKARSLQVGSVSGDITLSDAACDRLEAKSVSGTVEYGGTLARSGRYSFNSHSGAVRLLLANDVGFIIEASTFSGSIRSDLPLTIGGDTDRDVRRRGIGNRSIRGRYGDASALLTIRSFSGDIVIQKR